MKHKEKILFVCLGNICRSPAGEGILKNLIQTKNLSAFYELDSAGTSGNHDGELADERMRQAAKKRGLDLTSISRKFLKEDFTRFDYIIVMDDSNYSDVLKLDINNEYSNKVYKMADYATAKFKSFDKVPDPYFGGEDGFDLVLDLLENTCQNFLKSIHEKH